MTPPTTADGTPPAADSIDDLSFEEARAGLEDVVRALESGTSTLEESLALWERGEALADHCQKWLEGARSRIEEVRARRVSAPAEE